LLPNGVFDLVDHMKHWIACFVLVVLALIGAGCDSINQSQIQVLPGRTATGATIATVPASERDAVKQVLQEIALKYKLQDRTAQALYPGVICDYYQPVTIQPPVKHPIRLTAWVSGDRIVVDLMQKTIEGGEPMAYQNLRDEIVAGLQSRFGDRVTRVPKTQQATARVEHTP
jgi:hypothetical protein